MDPLQGSTMLAEFSCLWLWDQVPVSLLAVSLLKPPIFLGWTPPSRFRAHGGGRVLLLFRIHLASHLPLFSCLFCRELEKVVHLKGLIGLG